jgi:hypothetical protein
MGETPTVTPADVRAEVEQQQKLDRAWGSRSEVLVAWMKATARAQRAVADGDRLTEALAARISIFELARVMGTSVKMIDRTYGHLARDSETSIRQRLDARAAV